MFGSIFRPYGRVWTICNTVTDILGLSVLWCFCALPVVTLGSATTALYDAVVHGIRRNEAGVYRRFLRTFRAELKTGAAISLLWVPVLLFGSFVLMLLEDTGLESRTAALMAGGYRVLMLFPLGAATVSCILLSRFTHSFRSLTSAALQCVLQHLPTVMLLAVLVWAGAWLCAEYLLPFAFAPAAAALACSLPGERLLARLGGALGTEDGQNPQSIH